MTVFELFSFSFSFLFCILHGFLQVFSGFRFLFPALPEM